MCQITWRVGGGLVIVKEIIRVTTWVIGVTNLLAKSP